MSLKSKKFIWTACILQLDVHQSFIIQPDAFVYLKYIFSFNYDFN